MLERTLVLQQMKAFVVRELLEGDDVGLDSTTKLLELGLIDSISVLKLVTFVRDTYCLDVPSKELKPDNLETLDALANLVVRLAQQPR